MPPNPVKHRFRQSPSFHFSTANFSFRNFFRTEKKFGRVFGQDLQEMAFFGRLQQIAEGFLFQIHLLSGLYGSWSRKYDLTPHHVTPTLHPQAQPTPPSPHAPNTNQPLFEESLQTSQDVYQIPFNLFISRDVCKNSSKSG